MAITTLSVYPGDDLYRVAAEQYGDASAWTLIDRVNPQLGGDPLIQSATTIVIPVYNRARAGDGVIAPAR